MRLKTGGGGRLRRVGFLKKPASASPCTAVAGFGAKNGDYSARAAVTYAKYAPLHALAKPHFYHPNTTAGDFKLESTFLSSLRALAQDKAWQSIPHKSSPRTLESKRHKLHTSTYSLHIILESQAPLKSPTTLESTFDKTQMDCHAIATALARNDKNNTTILNTPQTPLNLDSSKSPSDSKILDEKCGLQGKSQGSYLSGNDCRDFSPLPHLSSKAESPQAQKLNRPNHY